MDKSEKIVEVEMLSGTKITIRSHKMSQTELERSRAKVKHERNRVAELLQSGEWWRAWEDNEELLAIARDLGYLEGDFTSAIKSLKAIFSGDWLKSQGSPTRHPMVSWLVCPQSFRPNPALDLGYALSILGVNNLSAQAISDLLHRETFGSRSYEIEVLGWLKERVDKIILEHELGIAPDKPKPDAKIEFQGHVDYVEIRRLNLPDYQSYYNERSSKLMEELAEAINDGVWRYEIDLGSPTTLSEAQTAFDTAEDIINRNKPPFDDRKGKVRIRIEKVCEGTKKILGSLSNLGYPELWEINRMIQRSLIDTASKLECLPKDSSLIVITRPFIPMLRLAILIASRKDIGDRAIKEIFEEAISKDERVKRIRQAWIDLTIESPEELKRHKERRFVFIPIANPYFK